MNTPRSLAPAPVAPPGPKWLVLVVNNFCNLKCRMCDVGIGETGSVFHGHLVGDDPRNMPLDLLETVLDQAEGFPEKPRVGLAYTEPLLHREVVAMCRTIVARGFHCSLTTNGFLLARLAAGLVEAGVHDVVISVDGPAAVHDRVRGVEGSFARLYEGAERLRAATRAAGGGPSLRLSYTITDANYTAMADFAREVAPLAPAELLFSHLNFITDAMAAVHNLAVPPGLAVTRSNLGAMELDRLDFGAMAQALLELRAWAAGPESPPTSIVPDTTDPAALAVYYTEPLRFVGGRRCTDPWRMLMVRTDGSIAPAHGRCYDVPLGNVADTTLSEAWNGAQLAAFRRTLTEAGGTLPACARCCGVIGSADAG